MLGAEKAYAKLEQKLQRYLDTYEATHNYDEYHFIWMKSSMTPMC